MSARGAYAHVLPLPGTRACPATAGRPVAGAPVVVARPVAAIRTTVLPYVFVLLGLAALALFTASRYAAVAQVGYEIGSMKAELRRLEAEREQLELKVAQLSSLARIEGEARSRLGMVSPAEQRLVAVQKGDDTRLASGTERAVRIAAYQAPAIEGERTQVAMSTEREDVPRRGLSGLVGRLVAELGIGPRRAAANPLAQ